MVLKLIIHNLSLDWYPRGGFDDIDVCLCFLPIFLSYASAAI